MFWSRSSSKSDRAEEVRISSSVPQPVREKNASNAPKGGDEAEAAIDTVGAILRTLGRHAINVEDGDPGSVAQDFEDWARHVLVLAPRPGRPVPPPGEMIRRDWGGLRIWLSAHRKAEAEHVDKAIADLRSALWTFVRCFAKALSVDGESDTQVKDHLQRLKGVAEMGTTQDIKREALAVAESIGEVLANRKIRQATQMEELADRLKCLGTELEEAKREGAMDALTRLFNRGAFDEHVSRMVDMSCVFGQRACLLLLDVDHFKVVNDTHGHPAGDAVLRELADCITRSFLRKGDFVARYGGEEFAVVVSEAGIEDGMKLAERLRGSISRMLVEHQKKPIHITASIGVASAVPGQSAAEWLSRADRALYAAKNAGRDRVMSGDDLPAGSPSTPTRSDSLSASAKAETSTRPLKGFRTPVPA